jgi:hypothetical protein
MTLALETAQNVLHNLVCRCGHVDTEHLGKGRPCTYEDRCDCKQFSPVKFVIIQAEHVVASSRGDLRSAFLLWLKHFVERFPDRAPYTTEGRAQQFEVFYATLQKRETFTTTEPPAKAKRRERRGRAAD